MEIAGRRKARGRRVLLADDNHDVRWVLGDLLNQELEMEVVMAEDGDEVEGKVDEHRPDIIVLDLMMPSVDGLELLRRLKEREDTRSIPVIAVTALSSIFPRDVVLEAGAADFVEKPFDFTELLESVCQHLG